MLCNIYIVFLLQLDPYDYERLKFVLEEMHKIEPTAMIKQVGTHGE